MILLNLLNSGIKRLLSDGFHTASLQNFLKKSHNPQTLSHTRKTIILLKNFYLV